ncbi:ParA family protein [Campylobacter lari]|uniref:ParA family protein n=1 Tax=Campylobacter volucris TaxID=1031542 RepID=UPI0018A088D7|nr:ParA family protein [Campylobacter volucris]EFO9318209.1 ParA family protein [Campylobacter lari]MBF7048147.1 ParA family protein [Campylobacter volucris]HED1004898.1 ParA family protein [Campylobacter jejuni]
MKSKIISICNEKGGSGKSTIAINLAIALADKKDDVLLIDADPQQSIQTFVSIRESEGHLPKFDYEFKIGDEYLDFLFDLKNENNQKYKYILSDTGGRDSKEMRYALSLSDIVIIPVIPSQIDVSVFDRMVDVLKEAKEENPKLKTFVLINNASTNPFLSKKNEELKEYIKEMEDDFIKLIDFTIFGREKYKISIQMGLGVTEMQEKNENKASIEMKKLSDFIKEN